MSEGLYAIYKDSKKLGSIRGTSETDAKYRWDMTSTVKASKATLIRALPPRKGSDRLFNWK